MTKKELIAMCEELKYYQELSIMQDSAKEMFEELGYEYDYVQGKNSEDTITYHKDNLHIQFNLISKIVILQNDTSYMFYNSAVFMIDIKLLKAINKQVEELGWKI